MDDEDIQRLIHGFDRRPNNVKQGEVFEVDGTEIEANEADGVYRVIGAGERSRSHQLANLRRALSSA